MADIQSRPNKDLNKKRKCYLSCAVVTLVIGLLFLAAAIAIPLVVDVEERFITGARENAVLIGADPDAFASWKDTSVKGQFYKLFVFNVTNPEEYIQGANVHVEAIGPFVYESILKKVNLNYSEDEEIVTFHNWQQARFVPERSIMDNDDLALTVIDPVYCTMLSTREIAFFKGLMDCCRLAPADNNTDLNRLITQRTVHDIFFGYEDDIAQEVQQDGYPGVLQTQETEEEALNMSTSSMVTGKSSLDKVRQYVTYEGKDDYRTLIIVEFNEGEQPLWRNGSNDVGGRDVFQWTPGLTEDSILDFFVVPLKRPVAFKFSGERPEYYGVPTMRFVIDPEKAFTEGFYNEPDQDGYLFNVSRAYFGGPNYLFNPMMLDAPEGATDTIDGLTPNRDEHTSFIDVEPRTGVTLNARVGFQLSLDIPGAFNLIGFDGQPQEDVIYHENVQAGYVPLFYSQVEGQIEEADGKALRTQLFLVDNLHTIAMAVGYSMFGVCTIIAFLLFHKVGTIKRQMAVNTRNRLLGDLVDM